MNQYPAYFRPAGQAATATISPMPQGLSVQGFNAAMQPIMAAGLNAMNQLVDAAGNLVLDASGRPITNPTSTQAPAPTPTPTPASVPAVVPPQPVAATPTKRGYGFFGMLATAAVIAGASYIGAYYGAKKAVRA